jgi:hypothetical protein
MKQSYQQHYENVINQINNENAAKIKELEA